MNELLSAYRRLLAEIDAWSARCERLFPDQIRCARGCSGCCRGLIDITLLDAALLQEGLAALPAAGRRDLLREAQARLAVLAGTCPDLPPPFRLDRLADERRVVLAAADETPCLLLAADGSCRLYPWRPMTCRLHGLPNVDLNGELLSEGWCTLNFHGRDPLAAQQLRGDFERFFRIETELLSACSIHLFGSSRCSVEIPVPAALLFRLEQLR